MQEWTWVIKMFQDAVGSVIAYIPGLLGALLLFVIGWLVAKAIRTIVTKGLKIVRFDIAAGKAGISNALVKGGIKHTPAELIGILVYWSIMLMVIVVVLAPILAPLVSQGDTSRVLEVVLGPIIDYMPNVIASVFVLVLGMFLANFVAGIVRTASSNAGVTQAKILGDITQYIIVIFTVVTALGQLDIEIEIIIQVIGYVVAGICLAFGLAFGLGCKEIAGDFMKRLLGKYIKEE